MHLRNLKELYVFIDLLISSLQKEDYTEVVLKISGILFKDTDTGIEKVHVSDALCKVSAEYTESGISVSSTTTKTVVKWLSQSKQGDYTRANSYLSFIDALESVEVLSVMYNGVETLQQYTNERKVLNLTSFIEFVNKTNCDFCITFENNGRKLPMLYTDGVFSRYVKVNGKCTMYINTDAAMQKFLENYTINNFMICYGIPCITTRIDMYRSMAEMENLEFNVVTNNG